MNILDEMNEAARLKVMQEHMQEASEIAMKEYALAAATPDIDMCNDE